MSSDFNIKDFDSCSGGIIDGLILRHPKNALINQVCSISKQIKAKATIDGILTVRLKGNGVCKCQTENLELGATQYYIRKKGQLIYGKQNFHNGAIAIIPDCFDGGMTSKDIPSFDINPHICNSKYLLAQLSSPKSHKPIESLTTGTGSKRLHEEAFLKIPIVLPPIEEQDRISTIIELIEAKLANEELYYNLICKQKKYFLQQMFI